MANALESVSYSFADMTNVYGTFIGDKVLGQALKLAGVDNLPDDYENQVTGTIKNLLYLALTYTSPSTAQTVLNAGKKIDSAIAAVMGSRYYTSIPLLGRDAGKLVKLAEAMGVDPLKSTARLVIEKISFDQAKDGYSWTGTLMSAHVTGGDEFVVYFPGVRISFGGNPSFVVTKRTARGVKGPNVRFG